MIKPMGITRVRNEALIIEDTIRHFLKHCSGIILYDDCSTDDTPQIAQRVGGPQVLVIRGEQWITDRVNEETRHRKLLFEMAKKLGAEWVLCFDADERLVGDLPDLTAEQDGYRFRLFDAYMTNTHCDPYRGGDLAALPRMFGPEYRDILMLFKTDSALFGYVGQDRREPVFQKQAKIALSQVKVKHYGKGISEQQWEETCKYYAKYFPTKYRKKWEARKGKAIHTLSDFHRTLYTWRQLMDSATSWIKI